MISPSVSGSISADPVVRGAFAEVSVNSSAAGRRTYSYAIPPHLEIRPGQAVWAPFGQRLLQGIVCELAAAPAVEQVRDIAGVIDPEPLLSPQQIALGRWMSDYYLSPLFEALAVYLPPGFERKVLTYLTAVARAYDESKLDEAALTMLLKVQEGRRVSLREFEKKLGKRKAGSAAAQLAKMGVVAREYELEKPRVSLKLAPHLKLAAPREKVLEAIASLDARAVKQKTLLAFLAQQGPPLPLAAIKDRTGADRTAANSLVKRGLAAIENVPVRRAPGELAGVQLSQALTLTPAQQNVLRPICDSLRRSGNAQPRVFLLHGVTGSGKTEIYLQALAEAVRLGKRGIVLVPEIALTPQTIERFVSRFPGRVAVLHSHLSIGEQFDEWHRCRNGDVDVVIGPRSALFAPVRELGLIVIDEEHEWTYKQHEQSPRYHARDVTFKMNQLLGSTVLMGSATPSIESFYRSRQGIVQLLQLKERIARRDTPSLPGVEVIDMRNELKEGNRSIFSRRLTACLDAVVEKGQQAILFLNRRGASTYVQCRNCGYVVKCRRCDVPLTYHMDSHSLVCHQCNYRVASPQICPRCMSKRIRYLGIGTEKLEEEVRLSFPKARTLRWDRDVTRGRYSHQRILDKFRTHEADILIGTQMVAKGLDLPLVTLVGVINADLGLYLPDFRAGERTFQLLTQVAGRAGRGQAEGRVIVQTYSPGHYAIEAAARHDYLGFYEREIAFRRELRQPPFAQLATLQFTHANEKRCQDEAKKLAEQVTVERQASGAAIELIGPAPAFIARLRGRYRWQLILRGTDLSRFLGRMTIPRGWTVDVDPVGL